MSRCHRNGGRKVRSLAKKGLAGEEAAPAAKRSSSDRFFFFESIASLIRRLFVPGQRIVRGASASARNEIDRICRTAASFESAQRPVRPVFKHFWDGTMSRARGRCARAGPPQRNLPFHSNVSRPKGFIADVSSVLSCFLSFFPLSSPRSR